MSPVFKNLIQLQFVIFIVLSFTAKSTAVTPPSLRLPNTTFPTSYSLHITTEIHKDIFEYSGSVGIILHVKENTGEIVLHAQELQDFEVNLSEYIPRYRLYKNLNFSHDNETSFLKIFSPVELVARQTYYLEIKFIGNIGEESFGFYRTSYTNDLGNSVSLAATQFEPTSARMAFPCFDEPAFKATFNVTITHGSNYIALSNMPINGAPIKKQAKLSRFSLKYKLNSNLVYSFSPDGEMTTTQFLETPPMSTYLLAFVISDYENISLSVDNIQHRMFFPPKSEGYEQTALQNAVDCLTVLGNLFDLKYTLPKLDYVRLPKTFGLAMENWGLITFNKAVGLSTENGDDDNNEEVIKNAIVLNHEISHQWFGNLVSPKWWSYVWLNEGFATYFAYLIAELMHPNWNITERFIKSEVNALLSMKVYHAMTRYVSTESEIRENFDVVCYMKSASVLRMFHHAIGNETFITGISKYLKRFKNAVVDEDDLFAELDAAVRGDPTSSLKSYNISTVFRSWTQSQLIPMVKVERNYNNKTITFHQRLQNDTNEYLWIPINFATASKPNFRNTKADAILLPQESSTFSVKTLDLRVSNTDWLIVNKQQTGLYFVIYDDQNMELIAHALKTHHTRIHKLNRALLFRDLNEFLQRDAEIFEEIKFTSVLSLLDYLRYEDDLMTWDNAADLMINLLSMLDGSVVTELLKDYIRGLVGNVFDKLLEPFPNSENDLAIRSNIIDLACKVDLPNCLDYSKNLTDEWFFNGQAVEDPAKDVVLCHGIRDVLVFKFEKLIEMITKNDTNRVMYDDFLFAVRCVEHPDSIKYFLNMLVDNGSLKPTIDMPRSEKVDYVKFWFASNFMSRNEIAKFLNLRSMDIFTDDEAVEIAIREMSEYVPNDIVPESKDLKIQFDELLSNLKIHFPNLTSLGDLRIGAKVNEALRFKGKQEESIYHWLQRKSKSSHQVIHKLRSLHIFGLNRRKH